MNELIKNKTKAEVLVNEIKKMKYGDVILHSEIANIIDAEYRSNNYTTTIAKARKLLIKQGICLENIPKNGYRIVEPDDFVDHSLRHYKRGFNEMQKGYDILDHAPTKDMTPEGLDTYRRINDRAISLRASLVGVRAELKTLSEKKHPFLTENVGRR